MLKNSQIDNFTVRDYSKRTSDVQVRREKIYMIAKEAKVKLKSKRILA